MIEADYSRKLLPLWGRRNREKDVVCVQGQITRGNENHGGPVGSGGMGKTQFLWGMLPKAKREEGNDLDSTFFPYPLAQTRASH